MPNFRESQFLWLLLLFFSFVLQWVVHETRYMKNIILRFLESADKEVSFRPLEFIPPSHPNFLTFSLSLSLCSP